MIDWLQNKMTFFPSTAITRTPQDLGVPFEELAIATADGEILGAWWINARGSEKLPGALLYLHGNAGNLSDRAEIAVLLADQGCDLLVIDYRGYGRSTGSPDEKGLYTDAQAALGYLVEKRGIALSQITVFGSSLGGAVAVHLAATNPIGKLILESTFTGTKALARDLYPTLPLRYFMKDRFRSLELAPRLTMPKLVVHGSRDSLIGVWHAKQLFSAMPEPKELLILEGAEHNDTWGIGGRKYLNQIKAFIKKT